MPNTKPHVHKRSSSGEAVCGRGGAHPRLTAYTDEVTCTYCALGVTGISGHAVHPVHPLIARWDALKAHLAAQIDHDLAVADAATYPTDLALGAGVAAYRRMLAKMVELESPASATVREG